MERLAAVKYGRASATYENAPMARSLPAGGELWNLYYSGYTGDIGLLPASQCDRCLISVGAATCTTTRESAERDSPSLPGFKGCPLDSQEHL